MLQHFLVIRPSGAAAADAQAEEKRSWDEADRSGIRPETAITALGFRVQALRGDQKAKALASKCEAVILAVPSSCLDEWVTRVLSWRDWPVIWWCGEAAVTESCHGGLEVDGVLFPGMTPAQIHWTLMISSSHHLRRTQWQKEREQLLGRLEERKWIERAKAILCEMKQISEADAYDFLRTQAMNERKRVVDVASSIVNVYQWISENKTGGSRK
jgi:two-component system, response regulator / RNA-binding antiterminator